MFSDPNKPVEEKINVSVKRVNGRKFWKDATHNAIENFNINLNKVDNVIDVTEEFSYFSAFFNNSEKDFASFVDQHKPLKIVKLMNEYPDYNILLQFKKADGNVLHFPLNK